MCEMTGEFQERTQAIAQRRETLNARWEAGWSNMLNRWAASGPDAVWLMYAASYLMRTSGVRWAVDPVTLRNRLDEAAPVDVAALADLSFVIMTHDHADHVDRELLAKLSPMAIRWIVPTHMAKVAAAVGVPGHRIIVPQPMHPIELAGVRITPFPGMHWEYPAAWGVGAPCAGVDATGYVVEWGDHRLLLPGDTRTYDASALPNVGPVDTLFGHVWLGRGAAVETQPPLVDAFCDFLAALQPTRRVVLAHLWEVSREAGDYWDRDHAELVRQRLNPRLEGVSIDIPDLWEALPL